MNPQNKYILEQSINEPEAITILRGGFLLAEKLIPLIKDKNPIFIEAHGEGAVVACIASKLLEPDQRCAAVLGITVVSVLSAIHALRKYEVQKFIKKLEHKNWDFGSILEGYRAKIQKDLLGIVALKTPMPYIAKLTYHEATSDDIPDVLQPNTIIIHEIISV